MASYPRMIKCCLFFCKTLISAWSGKRRSGSSRGLPLLVGSLDQSEGTRGGKSGDKRLRFRERKVTYLSGYECVCIALCKARITTVTFCALWGRKSGRKVGPVPGVVAPLLFWFHLSVGSLQPPPAMYYAGSCVTLNAACTSQQSPTWGNMTTCLLRQGFELPFGMPATIYLWPRETEPWRHSLFICSLKPRLPIALCSPLQCQPSHGGPDQCAQHDEERR
jgi:hypothetical protein